MAFEGPLYSARQGTDSSVGDTDWSNPENIASEDASNASVMVSGDATTYFLTATGFSFTFPFDAIVQGIRVEVRGGFDPGANDVEAFDSQVSLIRVSGIESASRASGTHWHLEEAREYGGDEDLWDASWSGSDIRADEFGVAFSVLIPNPFGHAVIMSVDYIRVTVYYAQIAPGSISSGEVVSTPSVIRKVSPSGIGTGESYGTPSLALHNYISPGGLSSVETFGTLRLQMFLLPSGIGGAVIVGTPDISFRFARGLPPGPGLTSTDIVYLATVGAGAGILPALTNSLIANGVFVSSLPEAGGMGVGVVPNLVAAPVMGGVEVS